MINLDIPLEYIDSMHWSDPDLYIYTKKKEKLVKFLTDTGWKDQWNGGDTPRPSFSFFERTDNEFITITDNLETFEKLVLSQRLATKLYINNDNPNKGCIYRAFLYGNI